ncbi:hypothetical protein [Streptomyces sp. NPDC046870]|uniref:hypothetical protein n=1 Tax=Streptomyces sp. NPDC046870 TaxID=3155135 RepID=UPI0034558783
MSHETRQSLEQDGWRAAVSVEAGHIVLRSRRGTHLLPAFPDVRAGCAQPPDATALDGELVVWDTTGERNGLVGADIAWVLWPSGARRLEPQQALKTAGPRRSGFQFAAPSV